MGDQFAFRPGDLHGDGGKYTRYNREDVPYNDRDFRTEGGYFNDSYGDKEEGRVDEYEEYTF
jgi:hypothetical protein